MKTITVERVNRDGGSRISLRFAYDQELIEVVKELPDARWSSSGSYWHISDSLEIISLLLNSFHGKAYLDYSALNLNLAEKIRLTKEEKQKEPIGRVKISSYAEFPILSKKGEADIARYKRWMEANRYPKATVQTYTSMMIKFLKFVSPREAIECTGDDLIRLKLHGQGQGISSRMFLARMR
jgi:integrase/recombinase XerD